MPIGSSGIAAQPQGGKLLTAESCGQCLKRLPSHAGDHRFEGNCHVRHAHQLAVLAPEQRVGELVEAQREHAGQSMTPLPLLGSEDGTVGHRLRPGDVLLDRHRQGAAHDAADDRSERRADHVVGHVAGRQQSLQTADVDEPRTAAATHHRDELLVADLRVELGGGEVIAVVLEEKLPLLVLVVGESREDVARRLESLRRITQHPQRLA